MMMNSAVKLSMQGRPSNSKDYNTNVSNAPLVAKKKKKKHKKKKSVATRPISERPFDWVEREATKP